MSSGFQSLVLPGAVRVLVLLLSASSSRVLLDKGGDDKQKTETRKSKRRNGEDKKALQFQDDNDANFDSDKHLPLPRAFVAVLKRASSVLANLAQTPEGLAMLRPHLGTILAVFGSLPPISSDNSSLSSSSSFASDLAPVLAAMRQPE